MRFWQVDPSVKLSSNLSQDYEAVGYVLEGQAELYVDSKVITLMPGDAWIIPAGAVYTYRVLKPFKAVEVVHPPRYSHRHSFA